MVLCVQNGATKVVSQERACGAGAELQVMSCREMSCREMSCGALSFDSCLREIHLEPAGIDYQVVMS